MNWLGRYEFGQNFKPFKVEPGVIPKGSAELMQPGYWVEYWCAVYRFLLKRHADQVIWFDHDEFCKNPQFVLTELEHSLGLEECALQPFAENISNSRRTILDEVAIAITPAARELHRKLKECATTPRHQSSSSQ